MGPLTPTPHTQKVLSKKQTSEDIANQSWETTMEKKITMTHKTTALILSLFSLSIAVMTTMT